MSFKKHENRISDVLKHLLEATQQETQDSKAGHSGSTTVMRRLRQTLEPKSPSSAKHGPHASAWPIGGELPSKSSSRLFSWRADKQVQDAIANLALYLESQRDRYYPEARPLSAEWKCAFAGFYSDALLDRVRIAKLKNHRVENPWFFEEAKASGFTNLPDMAHRPEVTFLDVIVFNENITARHLFHGLVHSAQVKLLGVERYAELFVAGFLQSQSFFLVPLKAHAFALDTRYAEDPETRFSVEEEVMRWAAQDRY